MAFRRINVDCLLFERFLGTFEVLANALRERDSVVEIYFPRFFPKESY